MPFLQGNMAKSWVWRVWWLGYFSACLQQIASDAVHLPPGLCHSMVLSAQGTLKRFRGEHSPAIPTAFECKGREEGRRARVPLFGDHQSTHTHKNIHRSHLQGPEHLPAETEENKIYFFKCYFKNNHKPMNAYKSYIATVCPLGHLPISTHIWKVK